MSDTAIGNFQVTRVVEQSIPFTPARQFFPDLTEEMLATCIRDLPAGQFSDKGELMMSFHAFVVRTGRYTIVVDTCCGNDKDRRFRPIFSHLTTDFMPALRAANVRPEEVDFVMCTHLHWDHVGWNTQLVNGQWVPTFPNARYIMSRKEFEHWDRVYQSGVLNNHTLAFRDSVEPIARARQAVLVEDDYELDNGIWVEPCPGHTPGNFVINVASKGQQGVITGDVIHHQVQLRFPEMSTTADDDKDLARTTRTALIERHADTGHLLLPAHFPAPSVGRIVSSPTGGFRYDTSDRS
ncbi:MBL fold metallo-hydrolase [Diaphorobacter sp. HDW4A]|uniref:MBL fold metallo-hydrolase n=1 Tax=Diaphorobacter sp. HDW4A TaxID=2714924 RepID=UPI00140A4F83|nr:MBL fold metallo-hydrolase [Diaphorobacter sp. HDW4A]QIL80183.1 MBL fold metallo-hydrolase [Diaphorobacter sp. HDW4A]